MEPRSGTVIVTIDVGAGNEANEEVMVSPLKEEAYHVLACLTKKCGLRPDFLRAMMSPNVSDVRTTHDYYLYKKNMNPP